ncbi:hypothetical protein NE237_019510 [Protea cynaroides]|uniref:Uncharacterized protein n=1 Tax=Protea cynaroides TaxID=273540 RepID=A0A9Q0JTF7_9MAGN|nr:hypothetical protein NE237_019510 [Protea cynaroides]
MAVVGNNMPPVPGAGTSSISSGYGRGAGLLVGFSQVLRAEEPSIDPVVDPMNLEGMISFDKERDRSFNSRRIISFFVSIIQGSIGVDDRVTAGASEGLLANVVASLDMQNAGRFPFDGAWGDRGDQTGSVEGQVNTHKAEVNNSGGAMGSHSFAAVAAGFLVSLDYEKRYMKEALQGLQFLRRYMTWRCRKTLWL